mgnify:CR=1 FL=1
MRSIYEQEAREQLHLVGVTRFAPMGDPIRLWVPGVPFRLNHATGGYDTGDQGDAVACFVHPDGVFGSIYVASVGAQSRYVKERRCEACGTPLPTGALERYREFGINRDLRQTVPNLPTGALERYREFYLAWQQQQEAINDAAGTGDYNATVDRLRAANAAILEAADVPS